MDFEEVRQWYDGYDFPGYGAIYNPYSVMCAMQAQKCRFYWKKTSAAESLMTYINSKGIADVVYLPKHNSMLPALVVELKWNKSSEGAIQQIKERDYPAVLKDYGGEIVLVGISYEMKKKVHSCMIERV